MPDGSGVYVPHPDDGRVSVIDTATNTVTATVRVGEGPFYALVSPDGSAVYIHNSWDETISVIGRE